MIWAMIAEQREVIRQMFLNTDEPTVPIIQPELNIEQSEEENDSSTVSQVEPRVVMPRFSGIAKIRFIGLGSTRRVG